MHGRNYSHPGMREGFMRRLFSSILFLFFFSFAVHAQEQWTGASSQEVSEEDGVPVLVKHLPERESVIGGITFATDIETLRACVGDRPVFDLVEFTGGTEAASARYEAGTLVLIEYTNPQASTLADERFRARMAELPPNSGIVYRRIGNYGAFVFDVADEAAAGELLDRVKYEKTVQWLGEDPFLIKRFERYMVSSFKDIFFSTVLFILAGLATAILGGFAAGILFYRTRERRRATRTAFTDAGGMTRLNLDDLSEPLAPK